MLNVHFENAVDAIESARDTVLSLFELYATKSAQTTNDLVQRLTFLTLIIGTLGVVAGVFGMNFEEDFFYWPFGFWVTLGGMFFGAVGLSLLARIKRWI